MPKNALETLRSDLERFDWSSDISMSGDQWRNFQRRKHALKERAEALGDAGKREWDLATTRWHEYYMANREI